MGNKFFPVLVVIIIVFFVRALSISLLYLLNYFVNMLIAPQVLQSRFWFLCYVVVKVWYFELQNLSLKFSFFLKHTYLFFQFFILFMHSLLTRVIAFNFFFFLFLSFDLLKASFLLFFFCQC